MSTEPNDPAWRALGTELARQARALHLIKGELAHRLPVAMDFASIGILHHLVFQGSCRQGELAETAQLDPSTISRYVAQLVRAGYAERTIDPADGRVVHLAATAQGRELCTTFAEQRYALIAAILEHWSPEDVIALTGLLQRFNTDIEALRARSTTAARSTQPTSPRRTDG